MNGLFEATTLNWVLIALAAFIIGLSKAGLKGIDMMNVTIMALVFGGKASTGVVLPLLVVADILAVNYYHRHARWDHFWKLLPWIVIGVLVGVWIGKDLDEAVFRKVMAVIIMLIIFTMLVLELRKGIAVPQHRVFAVFMGLVSGFATMLGNLAGAISTIYFLAMRLEKNDFIGTAAWVFLIVNLFKFPFQVLFWKNITLATLSINLLLLPALLIGFFMGIRIVAHIRDERYRKVVLALTLVGALFIFIR